MIKLHFSQRNIKQIVTAMLLASILLATANVALAAPQKAGNCHVIQALLVVSLARSAGGVTLLFA